jgi:uncharacterized RDD family membrane protein YckC
VQAADSTLPAGFLEPTFGQRIAGRLIDGLVFLGAFYLVDQVMSMYVWSAGVVWWFLYEIACLTLLDGQTVGKRLVGTRVQSLSGDPLRVRQIGVRSAVLGLGSPFWFFLALPVLKGPLHRGVHDWLAGTVVTSTVDPRPEP